MQATVAGLFVYPVKSAHGIERTRVPLTPRGFEWDRQWMIVNPRGMFLTQRSHPHMARLVPQVREDALVIGFPGLPPLVVPLDFQGTPANVRVWDDACVGLDAGTQAAEWVSRALGEPLRLVRASPGMRRHANPKFAGAAPAPIGFPDGYPILVCNEASLADLNTGLPQPVPMDRFRPNLVLRGLPAWAEDRIETVAIGAVTLQLVKPCTRCTIPSIDQQTGEPSTDPAPALKKFRFSRELLGVMFGENAVIVSGVGNTLEQGAEARIAFAP
jgi:MOSC domain-containing protein